MSYEETFGAAPPLPRTNKRRRRLSELLCEMANDESRARVSVADLLQAMGDRAFGALLLVFALPNVLPTPPGTSGLLGIPLLFLSAQLMLRQAPWLPRWIADRSMERSDFAAVVDRAQPWIERAERLLRPRLLPLVHPVAERLLGTLCLILATVLVLPIPLGNMLPASAICLIALGILERDGVWIVLGVLMSVLSLALVGTVLVALLKGAIFVITSALAI